MKVRTTAPPPDAALLRRWRALGLRTDERLGPALARAARRWPDAIAVVDEHERCTFAQLGARAGAIAGGLSAAGVGHGDVVSWLLPNRVDAIAVVAATWSLGAISNPLVTIYRARELGFILDQLRPAAMVAAQEFRGRRYAAELDACLAAVGHAPRARLVAGASPGWRSIRDLAPDAAGPPPEDAAAGPDEPCLVLYTSGTTAEPKGVVHTSATLTQEVRSMASEWALSWRDVMFMASPLAHITGILQGFLVPAMTGARAVLADTWDAGRAVEIIEREGATYMAGATPFLQGLLDEYARRGIGRSALRQYCCGGAAVPPHLVERAQSLGITAYRAWGMTELPTATIANERDPLDRRARTDGRVADGVEVQAVDEHRCPLGPSIAGELRIRGPERTTGYVDPALNAGVIDADGWLYTGDVGVLDADGYVSITGRVKDIINRGGEKLSAREIEDLLAMHPAVGEVAVLGVPGGRLGERVCAAIVAANGASVDESALAAWLADREIARQKIPERWRAVDALPRTPAGKVQKFKLAELFTSS